ncbi:MAG TPA: cytochrome P450 [Acidimicrobiia bacterium]|jgi:cytochrome P450|nr:cytochrome P450 [Acidimicrobiia bacterium]HIL04684.1 cytochrome P450 [Acidimicrobiia bacterium]
MIEQSSDWATEYDIFDPTYVGDPYPIWADIRERCPIAHTDEYGGSWLPTRYDDVTAIARDVEHFSSVSVSVLPPPPQERGEGGILSAGVPPISADPPLHTWSRRLLLPWFSPKRVASLEPVTRDLCASLIDGFVGVGHADAAADYAQQIPVRIISRVLGVPELMSDTFVGWVRDILEYANDPDRRAGALAELAGYFQAEMQARRGGSGDDLITDLLNSDIDGESVSDPHILGTVALTLVAGIDTTWSAIGSSLWHLATHHDDQERLVDQPELLPTAVEEFLRAYSPVTMARVLTEDHEMGGCPMKAGDRVLLSFPAANRDPDQFPRPDDVDISREHNRHVAFGAGIHRCAGSNLARMELTVAIDEWLRRIPQFRLADDATVTWAGGQVRGPRSIPVTFPI